MSGLVRLVRLVRLRVRCGRNDLHPAPVVRWRGNVGTPAAPASWATSTARDLFFGFSSFAPAFSLFGCLPIIPRSTCRRDTTEQTLVTSSVVKLHPRSTSSEWLTSTSSMATNVHSVENGAVGSP